MNTLVSTVVIFGLLQVCCSSPCGSYPCLPGTEYMGIGYDAIQGQSTGAPIFQFTFDQKNFWVNPFQSNQSTFMLADQLTATNAYGMKTYSWSFEEAFTYSKFLANQYGIDVSAILDSSGWFLTQVAEMQQKVESEDQTFSVTEQSISLYELTCVPSATELSTEFQQDAASLPTSYDYDTYLSFVQSYGTHVVVSATLGGKSSFKTFADSKYTEANSNFVLGGNARSDFYQVKGSVGGDYSHTKATDDFKQHGVSNYERAGGDPTIDKNKWREWVDTLGDSPVVIKSHLKPIYDLVQDSTRSRLLKLTIDKYSVSNPLSNATAMKTYQLGTCNCYWTPGPTPHACAVGDVMQGFIMDGDSPYQTTQCCTPCFTWQSSAFRNTLDTQSQVWERAAPKRAEKQNRTAKSKCGKYECIPGLDSFGVMFDAVKGRSMHLPVIEFTFLRGKTWQNPLNPNLIYAVPDQVLLIEDPEELQYYDMINSTQSYQNMLSTSAGIDVDFMGFGLSDEVTSSSDTFFLSQNVLTVLRKEYSFYNLKPSFHWNVSKELQFALKNLASDQSSDKFSKFFQTYGTHYISSATYGGRSNMLTSVNQEYYSYNSEDTIEAMVGLMYDGFSLGFTDNVTQQSGFSDFYSSTFSEFYLEGGDYLTYSANQIDEWKKSIIYAPTQLQYKLQPIYSLINDNKLRNNFKIAASLYAQVSLTAPTSNAQLKSTTTDGVGNDQSSCDTTWANMFESYQTGTLHYELPLSCVSYYWSVDDMELPQQCNCQTSSDPVCPPNTYVTQVTPYSGWSGNFPKLPMNCCGVCAQIRTSQ